MTRQAAVNAAFGKGIDPPHAASYIDHYAVINPWMAFWETIPAGRISLSERDCPSSSFRDSEFYTGWLDRQDHLKAACGVRLDVDRHNTVIVSWHYALDRAHYADRFTEDILRRVKDDLAEAVRCVALLREGLERSRRLGPLIERIAAPAALVDAERRIGEMNSAAAIAMARGDLVTGTGDVLALRDPAAQRWLEETVARLLSRSRDSFDRATFTPGGDVVRIGVTRAPAFGNPGFPLLVRPRPKALIVIEPLLGRALLLDAGSLKLAFGLSAVEIRLCELLANGRSLAEAADVLHLSEGTVRQRVKIVFQKTGTHRQGQLIALVSRFAAD